jgi:hypothetical protein
MATLRREHFWPVVLAGLIVTAAAGGAAKATEGEATATADGKALCAESATRSTVSHSALLQRARHPHKLSARRAPAHPRASVAAGREATPVLLASNMLTVGTLSEPRLACTGANAWSLLCPGAQIIGISY